MAKHPARYGNFSTPKSTTISKASCAVSAGRLKHSLPAGIEPDLPEKLAGYIFDVMEKTQQTPCDELFDDDREPIRDGQEVRVNGYFVGKAHINSDGEFYIDGWSHDEIIESLEVIPELPIDIDDVHPTIKM